MRLVKQNSYGFPLTHTFSAYITSQTGSEEALQANCKTGIGANKRGVGWPRENDWAVG